MAVERDGKIVGVGIAGRPVSRALADGHTVEVTRVATDGTRNACSMIYGALCRAAKALGYRRAITYTLESEPGTSLRASGWRPDGKTTTERRTWHSPSRPRVTIDLFGNRRTPPGAKIRWVKQLAPGEADRRAVAQGGGAPSERCPAPPPIPLPATATER